MIRWGTCCPIGNTNCGEEVGETAEEAAAAKDKGEEWDNESSGYKEGEGEATEEAPKDVSVPVAPEGETVEICSGEKCDKYRGLQA